MILFSMLVLYRSSGIDFRVIAVDKHIDAARKDADVHLLLLRVRIEELFRPQIDVLILDREQLSAARGDHDLLYGLLEGRSVVVGSNHV